MGLGTETYNHASSDDDRVQVGTYKSKYRFFLADGDSSLRATGPSPLPRTFCAQQQRHWWNYQWAERARGAVTRPPYTSPKWGWEPSLTMMRHVTTIVLKIEPADRCTDFLWPIGIRPLELRGPPALVQAAVPNNNAICEIINGPRWQVVPVTRPPNTSRKRDWEPTLTMMRHVWTMREEKEELLLPLPSPIIESSYEMRLAISVIGFLARVGLWLLAWINLENCYLWQTLLENW